MAAAAYSHNPDAETSAGYTPLPAGEYTLEIVESDYAATAKGTGMVLKCKAQVVGGEHDGRPFYLNYNLENESEKAAEIGQRDFDGLRRATGVLAPDDSEQLHFKSFGVKIRVESRKDTGELQNLVTEYLFDKEAAEPTAANENKPAPRAAAEPVKKATPWRK